MYESLKKGEPTQKANIHLSSKLMMSAETSIDMLHSEKTAVWYSSHPATIRKMKELKKEYPNDVRVIIDHTEWVGDEEGEVEVDREELSYEIEIPRDWVRTPRPKTKKNMTEEQRAQAGERLKKARANKKV